ncbi:MAG: T9SS type A sorting domain-containing protein [Bacteroidetes bacterium]|nr:T9SS type A sorting domain-containing protein [Bacteroidota bacterium]
MQFRTILFVAAVMYFLSYGYSTAQIANNYTRDVNIEADSNVIFVEMFEQTLLSDMLTGWTNRSPIINNIAFSSSVPSGSSGNQSLQLTTIGGNIGTEDTYIFKRFPAGFSDSIFVRYYVKFNTGSRFHHSGVWMGGNNPSVNYPSNHAGYKPAGDSAFHIGSEVRGANMNPQSFANFGFYNYWTGMHQSNDTNPSTGTGYYWGNSFPSSNPIANIDMSQWNCIEVMVKLNNPVTGSTGELALWINGVKISYFGYQFPDGNWNWSNFTEGTGTPFEGFQWRNNSALKFNYIWVKNYDTDDSTGHVNSINFDHIVVAKKYIGPINNSPLPVELSLFNATVKRNIVELMWTTDFEQNNSGFEIERKNAAGTEWTNAGYVKGSGNSVQTIKYYFSEKIQGKGNYNYRLKQIDNNGNYKYYELSSSVEIGEPEKFNLSQNYPNPFNPTTKIDLDIPKDVIVHLKIYDIAGREIAVLINGEKMTAGYYTKVFNGIALSSGTYFYVVQTDGQMISKRMVLVK